MKLLRLSLLLVCALAARAAGVLNASGAPIGNGTNWLLALTWTGDATSGTVPATTLYLSTWQISGYTLSTVEVAPGTPAPTTGYSLKIADPSGVDILGGAAASLSATVPAAFAPATTAPPLDVFTVTISGQSVASARGTIYLFLAKPTTSTAKASGSGSGAKPAGSAPDVQFNATASTFGADTGKFDYFKNAVAAPSAPVVTTNCVGGATTWGYKLVANVFNGALGSAFGSAASTEGTTNAGCVTLSMANSNPITAPACAAGVLNFDVYRSTGSPLGHIISGLACNGTQNDTGLPIIGFNVRAPSVGSSQGLGLTQPLVVAASKSSFGSAASSLETQFGRNGTGLSVVEHTGNPLWGAGQINQWNTLVVDTATLPDDVISFRSGGYLTNNVTSGNLNYIGIWVDTADNSHTTNTGLMTAFFSGQSAGTDEQSVAGFRDLDLVFGSSIGNVLGFEFAPQFFSPTISKLVGFQTTTPLGGQGAANVADLFLNERGAFEATPINTFNAVFQAVPRLHNPQAAQWALGGSNDERVTIQWESNEAVLRTEATGSGTLRNTKIDGAQIKFGSGVTPAATGQRYLCFTTAGQVVSSAAACSGT